MTTSHVVLKFDDFGKGSVIVDGVPLKSTISVDFKATVGRPTIVTVVFLASVEFEGTAIIQDQSTTKNGEEPNESTE